MTLEECHNIEPVSILSRLASQSPETFFKNYTEVFTPEQILTYIQKGGMPGICFLRSSAARNELWRAHLETVLDRDLNLILSSKFSFEKKEQLLRLLYEDPSNPKDYALLARLLSSSQPTVKALISAYEGLFLIRRHGPYFFPEDAGLAHTLAPDILNERLNLLLRYTYSRLLALTHYEMRGESKLQHFRTKGGAEVHFVLSTPSAVFGFVVDAGDGASEKSLKSLGSLGKTLKKRFIPCVIHMGKKAYLSSRTVFCIPWTWL
jgi:predicted AAA+ superfamily ATPase